MRLTRRALLQTGAAALAAPAVALDGLARSPAALAQDAAPSAVWKHGLSLFGDLKYPAGFKHFDYVNAECAEGRRGAADGARHLRQLQHGGGRREGLARRRHRADLRHADGGGARRGRRPSTACSPRRSAIRTDFSSVTYRLRANAKWHDGKPVTAEDVIFSFEPSRQSSAVLGLLQPRHQGGEDRRARGDLHLRRPGQSRAAADRRPAQRAAEALVGRHRQGRQQARHRRDHARAAARLRRLSLKEFVPGRTIVFERVADYWGKDLNVNIGRDNFDELRYEYFRDATVAIEAFKADAIDWRTENSAKNWATAYDFPAVKDKRVVQGGIPDPVLRRHAGASPSTSAGRSSPIRACAAPSTSRSTSRR